MYVTIAKATKASEARGESMVSEAPKLSVKIEGAIATIFVIPIISGMTGEAEKFNGTDGRPEFEAVVHLAPGDVLFLRK